MRRERPLTRDVRRHPVGDNRPDDCRDEAPEQLRQREGGRVGRNDPVTRGCQTKAAANRLPVDDRKRGFSGAVQRQEHAGKRAGFVPHIMRGVEHHPKAEDAGVCAGQQDDTIGPGDCGGEVATQIGNGSDVELLRYSHRCIHQLHACSLIRGTVVRRPRGVYTQSSRIRQPEPGSCAAFIARRCRRAQLRTEREEDERARVLTRPAL
jgi:hypothetical protein